MKKFNVIVWFRFVVNGEQEKEMQDYTIEAIDGQSAISLALDKFKFLSAIPFKTEVTEL